MWRSVIDWVLADIYPIGEKPCDVDLDLRGRDTPPAEQEMKGLLQTTTEILSEHEELISHARELENRVADPEEMGRFVRGLLPVIDAIERVLDFAREAPPSEELTNWLRSVEGVYFRLVNTLERQGLESLDTVGRPVDLNCEEVVEYIPSKEHRHDYVVSERQKGYRFRGKLLRDAKVVVAYNPKDR